jgi:hypothetical protein
MARKRAPGTFVIVPLGDGTFGYGRIIDHPNVAFYRYRTNKPETDLDTIEASRVAFTIAVRLPGTDEWPSIGHRELGDALKQPVVRFHQDIVDFRKCTIYDNVGNTRPATPEECEGLEAASVWEPNGVKHRLLDMFAGRPNEEFERGRVRRS